MVENNKKKRIYHQLPGIVLPGIVVIVMMVLPVVHATQTENYVGEFTVPVQMDESTSGGGALVPAAVILSQSSGQESSSGTSVNSEDEQGADSETDENDSDETFVLPQDASPVVIDSNLQAGSPIGHNTQTALTRPRGVRADSTTGFFPRLTVGVSSESNPQRAPGEVAKNTTDTVITITPAIVYRGRLKNRHAYELGAAARTESFERFTNLDANSVALTAALNLDITKILQGDIFASHEEGSDIRGATATREVDLFEPSDDYERDNFGGRVTIGRRSNILQLVLGVDQDQIKYTNNDQNHRDREDNSFRAGLYWNVGPKTSLYLNGRYTDIDYIHPAQSGYDSEETSTTVGVGWEPSYSTSVVFEMGNLVKDLKDPTLADYDDLTYAGRVYWHATNYTTLGVYGSLILEETIALDSPYIESELIGANLSHRFTDRFRGQTYWSQIEDDIVNTRQDDITDFGFGVYYDLKRWLYLGVGWRQYTRNSTDPGFDYEAETVTFYLGLKGSKEGKFGSIHTSAGVDETGRIRAGGSGTLE
jgi:hypothetical protein